MVATEKKAATGPSKQLASLLSGGVAGTFAATLTMPLEVVKTKLQTGPGSLASMGPGMRALDVARAIATTEGTRGFFRGLPPTVIGILPARATYFWAYDLTKNSVTKSSTPGHLPAWRTDSSPLVHSISAIAASGVSNTITNPIWMVKTRMQLQAGLGSGGYSGYGDAVVRIVREEGLLGFFRGLSASYWGISESVIHFVCYERIKRGFSNYNLENAPADAESPSRLDAYQYVVAAAMSKLIASSLTYPHEVVRTRMREQPDAGQQPKYRHMIQSLKLIAKEEGRAGLYAGVGAHLVRVVPNTALMFLTYETVMRWLEVREAM